MIRKSAHDGLEFLTIVTHRDTNLPMITTLKEFITAAGGRSATAKAFGVVDHAVSNWIKRGHFPGWAITRAMQLAQTNQWALAPELVTLKKPEPTNTGKKKGAKKAKPKSRTKTKHTIRLLAAE